MLVHAKPFCSVNNAGIYSFASIAKPPALHLWRRRQQSWLKLDLAYFLSLICESMAAPTSHTASRLLKKASSFLQGEGTARLGISQPTLAKSFYFSVAR